MNVIVHVIDANTGELIYRSEEPTVAADIALRMELREVHEEVLSIARAREGGTE